jgi:uncharacterized protein with GYD domain
MPTYILLVNLTRRDAENVDRSPDRLERAKETTESSGGEPKGFYRTFGRYDFGGRGVWPHETTSFVLVGERLTRNRRVRRPLPTPELK